MGSLRHPLGSAESSVSRGQETIIGGNPVIGPAHTSQGGVSHKIQQLLNTLKRPRKNKKPVEDYYQDDDTPGNCVVLICFLLFFDVVFFHCFLLFLLLFSQFK